MRNLFFYGSLQHLPLLELVLNRPADAIDTARVHLPDHAVYGVAEGPFPMIEACAGGCAQGVVVRGLSAEDIDRLDFYEGSFAYDLLQVTLEDGTEAEVYMPQPGLWTPDGPWDLAGWQAEWGDLSVTAAEEVMSYYGTRGRDAVARMFPMIRKRAQSRLNAAASRHGARTLQGRVEIDKRRRSYADFFALDDMTVRFEHFNGEMSPPADRAVFIAADAAILLPYDPVRDRVLLVEQMRMGPLARGDRSLWQLEPIAGHIDPGETPLQAATREAREEAGLTLRGTEEIAQVYASPGNSTEFYYIFLGLADLPDSAEGIGGLDSEGENIRAHVLSFDALMELVEGFGAANAPLGLAAFWLARHRERLRSAGSGATSGDNPG